MVDRNKKQFDPDEIVDGEVVGEFDSETFLNLPQVPDQDAPVPINKAAFDAGRRDFVLRIFVGGAAALALGGSAALLVNERQKAAQRTEVILPYGSSPGPEQPANVAELVQRIAALEYDLAAMTAERDQAISDLNIATTQAAELRAQLDAALAQLEESTGLNALWQALDDIGLDSVVAGALSIVGGALAGAMDVVALAQTGLAAAQSTIQRFLALISAPREGLRWLTTRMTALSNDLDWLSAQVQEAVEPVEPFTTLIAEFVLWVLDRLPFGAGDRAKAGLEAMQTVIGSLPDTVSRIRDSVLDPLGDWFGDDKNKTLNAILIDPVQQRGLNPAKDLVTKVAEFKSTYDEKFAIPAQAALEKRAQIRIQIETARAISRFTYMSEPNQSPERPEPTERFHRMLAFASDEADALGHGYITCQHLLYALSRESKGLASAALEGLGVTADTLHELLAESSAEHDRIEARIDLADEVREVIERAVIAAQSWDHRWLDTEHVLYGIVSARTSADEMLASLRIAPGDIASRLTSLQQGAPPAAIREEATHAYRFTLESAWLLSLSTDIARQHGGAAVTSLHLLIALLSLPSPARKALLDAFEISIDDITRRIRSGTGAGQGGARLPLGEDVQRILGYAIGEAWNRGHLAVAPLHIAMGLARAERHAALDVMAELGVSQADLADALSAVMPPATTR